MAINFVELEIMTELDIVVEQMMGRARYAKDAGRPNRCGLCSRCPAQ